MYFERIKQIKAIKKNSKKIIDIVDVTKYNSMKYCVLFSSFREIKFSQN